MSRQDRDKRESQEQVLSLDFKKIHTHNSNKKDKWKEDSRLSETGSRKGALTFAGQGVVSLDNLQHAYYSSAKKREYIDVAAQALLNYISQKEVRWSGLYKYGFDLISW